MRARKGWLGVATVVVALAIGAPPASASFPGADGQLVVTPLAGNGVILASARTGRAHRVCEAPQTCGGRATDARFSPDGREIVIRADDGRLGVSTVAGDCVWCPASLPHVTLPGTSPAFAPKGETITFVHQGLWEVAPGSSDVTRLRLYDGPVSAAVWSASGKIAAVRRGWLWTGIRKAGTVYLLKRLARGSAPVWSPDGRELAFTRKGFVFTVRTAGHRITRIARGSSPAFSPDGRSLAYLNRDDQATVRPLGHGPTRTLTRLRGRSLDWQPVTAATSHGCAAASGAVVASNGEATIRAAADLKDSHIGWNGCLSSVGIPFHLNGGFDGDGYNLTLGHVALAGDFAALEFVYTDKYMNYSDTVNVYDLRSGALVHTGAVRCGGFPCDMTGLAVNASGFAAWRASDTPHPPESAPTSISCPSSSLCVAGGGGDVLVSTDPTGGRAAWTQIQLAQSLPEGSSVSITAVSCPTVSFCLATDAYQRVFWSTDPAGGPGAWQTATNPPIVATFAGGLRIADRMRRARRRADLHHDQPHRGQ